MTTQPKGQKEYENSSIFKSGAFDVSYTINFSGIVNPEGDVVTPQMVRDKIMYTLEKLIMEGYIREFSVTVVRNNLKEAYTVLAKNKPAKKNEHPTNKEI